MNIPRPEEIVTRQEAAHIIEIEGVTSAIVRSLENATAWPVRVYENVSSVVCLRIVARFAEHGWRVTYHSEQREGSWIEVAPA